MSKSNYDAEQSEHASARRRAEELENALASMQVEHDKVTRMFDKTKKNFLQLKEQNAEVESELGATKESLETTTRELRSAERHARQGVFIEHPRTDARGHVIGDARHGEGHER